MQKTNEAKMVGKIGAFKKQNSNGGITLIALVVTIVLNCSFLAMVVNI